MARKRKKPIIPAFDPDSRAMNIYESVFELGDIERFLEDGGKPEVALQRLAKIARVDLTEIANEYRHHAAALARSDNELFTLASGLSQFRPEPGGTLRNVVRAVRAYAQEIIYLLSLLSPYLERSAKSSKKNRAGGVERGKAIRAERQEVVRLAREYCRSAHRSLEDVQRHLQAKGHPRKLGPLRKLLNQYRIAVIKTGSANELHGGERTK